MRIARVTFSLKHAHQIIVGLKSSSLQPMGVFQDGAVAF